jgi:hypothetical protein
MKQEELVNTVRRRRARRRIIRLRYPWSILLPLALLSCIIAARVLRFPDAMEASGANTAGEAKPSSSPASPRATPVLASKPITDAHLITLKPSGFVPAEVTWPQGEFLLVIEDRSGLEQTSFELRRQAGESLLTAHVVIHVGEWQDRLELHPGTYLLTEASHPQWVCKITVTP